MVVWALRQCRALIRLNTRLFYRVNANPFPTSRLDDGIRRQTEFEVESFIQASGRKLSNREREKVAEAVLQGMRWTYLGTGMTHRNFLDTVQSIKPAARAEIERMAPAFC